MSLRPDCPNCSHFTDSPRGHVVTFTAKGTTHAVPDMWVAGRMYGFQGDGMDVMEAHAAALMEWAECCELLIRHGMEAA